MTESRASTLRIMISLLAAGSASCAGCTDGGAGARGDASMAAEAGPTSSDAANGATGGDSGSPLTPDYKDGTRLRAQWWTHEGSEPLFAGWYDTQLKVRCRFELVDGGSYRCLPVEIRGDASQVSPAQCGTENVVQVGLGSSTPEEGDLAVSYAGSPEVCGERVAFSAVYRLGSALPYAAAPDCDYAGESSFKATKLSLDAFVSADLALAEVGDRLAVRMYVADDGSREPKALFDTKQQHECFLMVPDSEGIYRCVPREVGRPTRASSDDQCTERDLLEAVGYECLPVVSVEESLDPAACRTSHRFFKVGAVFDKPGYLSARGVCEPADPRVTDHYLRGQEVPASEFAGAKVSQRGNGRLRPLALTTLGDVALMPYRVLLQNVDFRAEGFFFDSELGIACRPKPAVGGYRCIPSIPREGTGPSELAYSYKAFDSWSDDTCSKSPLRFQLDGECAPSHQWQQDSAGPVTRVFTLSAPSQVEPIYRLRDGTCVAGGAGTYQRASEANLSMFAAIGGP